jgi:hypothetical protein
VRQSGQESQERLKVLTARFRNALKKSVEGIIEAGRVLIDAYDPKMRIQIGWGKSDA